MPNNLYFCSLPIFVDFTKCFPEKNFESLRMTASIARFLLTFTQCAADDIVSRLTRLKEN